MLDLYDAEVRIDNQSNSDVYQRHLGMLADAADVKVSREIIRLISNTRQVRNCLKG